MRIFLILSLFLSFTLSGQGIKSLNSYADYANESAKEIHSIFESISNYHSGLSGNSGWNKPRYVCPVQPDEYYYNKALQAPPSSPELLSSLKALRATADDIDKKCKALDTYHKLEDYKTDNYAAAKEIIRDLQPLFVEYSRRQRVLDAALVGAYRKSRQSHSYTMASDDMMKELARERAFLDKWRFNLAESVHTGWIVKDLEQSIAETDAALGRLKGRKPVLKYPASSAWPSFVEALSSILDVKRRALDEYNFEARKSDKHRNDVYMSLINYFNGALLADYNNFLNFAARDGFNGLTAIRYVPVFVIDEEVRKEALSISPFEDTPRERISVSKQSQPIPKSVYGALVSYVDFINETWRQVSHHRSVIRNLNSSASYVASLTSYERRAPLSFTHDDFEVPLSHFQKSTAGSKSLQPSHAASLNAGAQVLINILKEMDEIGAVLEQEVSAKLYQNDRVKHVYQLIERTHELFRIWDERKEALYEDIEKVYDSYPVANPGSSWNVSGGALRELTRLDRDGLFKAKAIYKGEGAGPVETQTIQTKLRDVIANEYTNMKGIEKYGRNHGLCPYTPYEDLPKSSRLLAEYLAELRPAKKDVDDNQHPYHSMVYVYNSVVDAYNKFCELSPGSLLPAINQPELFILVPPREPESSTPATPSRQSSDPQTMPVPENKKKEDVSRIPAESVKVIRDTVFIEKRDTIYLHDPEENIRSMEGFALNNMVLLLDVSGSMNAPEKLPLLKKSVLNMLSMMRQEDRISIVVFSGKPKVLLEGASFRDEEKILKAINALTPSGKTDGNAGLKLAYRVADDHYIRGGNNRIVLATDGEFPISDNSQELVKKFSGQDIFLTVFNFGSRNTSGKSLERLVTTGRGNYEFISAGNAESKLIREAKAKRQK